MTKDRKLIKQTRQKQIEIEMIGTGELSAKVPVRRTKTKDWEPTKRPCRSSSLKVRKQATPKAIDCVLNRKNVEWHFMFTEPWQRIRQRMKDIASTCERLQSRSTMWTPCRLAFCFTSCTTSSLQQKLDKQVELHKMIARLECQLESCAMRRTRRKQHSTRCRTTRWLSSARWPP